MEDVAKKGGFARATGAAHHGQARQREAQRLVMEVAAVDAGKAEPAGGGRGGGQAGRRGPHGAVGAAQRMRDALGEEESGE